MSDCEIDQCRFSGMKVGYFGDHAGVTLALSEPYVHQSSKPKDKMNRTFFAVAVAHESYDLQGLQEAIAKETSPKTREYMQRACDALQGFIKENGVNNPWEAVDFMYQPA